jgi:hypothetical protein
LTTVSLSLSLSLSLHCFLIPLSPILKGLAIFLLYWPKNKKVLELHILDQILLVFQCNSVNYGHPTAKKLQRKSCGQASRREVKTRGKRRPTGTATGTANIPCLATFSFLLSFS